MSEHAMGLDVVSINQVNRTCRSLEETVQKVRQSPVCSDWGSSLNLPKMGITMQKYKIIPSDEVRQAWKQDQQYFEGEIGKLVEYAQSLLGALQSIKDEKEKQRRRLSQDLRQVVSTEVQTLRDDYNTVISRFQREKDDVSDRVKHLHSTCSKLSTKLDQLRQEEDRLWSSADSKAMNNLQVLKNNREETNRLADTLESINEEARKTIKQIQESEHHVETLRSELQCQTDDHHVGEKRSLDESVPDRELDEVEHIDEGDAEAIEATHVKELQLENARLRTEIAHHEDIIERSKKQSVKHQLWDQHAEEIEELQRESAEAKEQLQKEISLKTNAASMLRRLIGATITHVTQSESTLLRESPSTLSGTCSWLWTLVEKNDGELAWNDALQELNASKESVEVSRDLLIENGLLRYESGGSNSRSGGTLKLPRDENEESCPY